MPYEREQDFEKQINIKSQILQDRTLWLPIIGLAMDTTEKRN